MTSALETAARIDGAPLARSAQRSETVTVLLMTWTFAGLFVDVWSHGHVAKLESFFTPWHAVFYSGFLALVGWTLWPVWRARRAGERTDPAATGCDSLSVLGIAIFTAGGLCDMVWHSLYGLERSFVALISPPHQLIFFGLTLITSAPFRHAWSGPGDGRDEPTFRSLLPANISLGMTMSIVAIVFVYQSALAHPGHITLGYQALLSVEFGQGEQSLAFVRDVTQHLAVSRLLVANLIMMIPALLLVRRWRPPFGSITIVWTIMGVAIGAASVLWYFPVLVLTGLFADWLARAGALSARIVRIRTVALVVPLVLWGSYFLLTHWTFGLAWPLQLWLGAMMLASACSLGVSLLGAPAGLETG